MITRERWQRIKELFNLALQRPAADRVKFLSDACEGDDSIRAEVESLISAHEEDESFLDGPAYEFAAEMLADESPELKAGDRLGPYTVLSVLGKGGMGEVYLAQDARLGRNIAVKLLAPEFARDEQRVLRFEQEARAASALNHPNVCVIHEIGRAEDGRHFMAMEFIDGLTLRRRMAQKRLTLTEALDVAVQVAWALEAAHAAGIVHRDIKPENIMLRRDGYVKVLDFGIAKLNRHPTHSHISPEVSTVAHLHTAPGTLMGTVKYMSPEQLREQPIDARTDIWSLGVVLHEMVTGFTPFEAPTTNDTIAAILERQPTRLDFFATEVPEGFRQVIRKALSKRRRARYQTIKELAADLRKLRRQQSNKSGTERSQQATLDLDMTGTDEKPRVETGGSTILSRFKLQALRTADYVLSEIKQHKKAAIFTGATAIFAALLLIPKVQCWTGRAPCSGGLSTPSWQTPEITRLTNSGTSVCAAISPDGKLVAHAEQKNGTQELLVTRTVNSATSELVPAAAVNYLGVTFSLDNDYLYFTRTEKGDTGVLYQVALPGSKPRKIKEGVDSAISFSPNGDRFSFVRFDPARSEYSLMIADTDGAGEAVLATRRGGSKFSVAGPAWSPDGKKIVCASGRWDKGYHMSLVEIDVESTQEKPIGSAEWFSVLQVAWLANQSGLIISAREKPMSPHQLWRVPYPAGQPKRITHELAEYRGVSLSGEKIVSTRIEWRWEIWVLPTTDPARAASIVSGSGLSYGLAWTGKGKIAFSSMIQDTLNISLVDPDGSNRTLLTVNAGDNYTPAASPDGRFIVFASNRNGSFNIWRVNANDGSSPKQLTFTDSNFYPAFSPDGQLVAYDNQTNSTLTVWKVPTEGGEAIALIDKYRMPVFSPDSQLIACRYDLESGSREVAIIPAGGGAPVRQVPIPILEWQRVQWTPNGNALSYIDTADGSANIWSYDLSSGSSKQLTHFQGEQIFAYAWSPDYKQLACERGNKISDVAIISDQP